MTTAGLACGTCGTELHENGRFRHTCGYPVTQAHKVAEYKQVTMLFADVLRSMEIAAAVGGEAARVDDRIGEPFRAVSATVQLVPSGRALDVIGLPQQRGEPPSRRADRRPRRFPVQCHYRHVATLVRRVPRGL